MTEEESYMFHELLYTQLAPLSVPGVAVLLAYVRACLQPGCCAGGLKVLESALSESLAKKIENG